MATLTKYRTCVFFASIIILLCLGCGSGHVRLQGKVTFEEDGTPLTTGRVCFQKDVFMAEGKIDENGTFTMGSFSEKDGLPKGTYKVFVSGATDNQLGPNNEDPSYRPLIHQKYASFDTTPYTCEVPAPGNRFDFTVQKP